MIHLNQVFWEFDWRQLLHTNNCSQILLKIISKNTIFTPHIVLSIDKFFLPLIFSIRQPISFKNSTSMFTVTAFTALLTLWKNNVSFVIDSQMSAWSGQPRQYRATHEIVLSVNSVHSLSIIATIVEVISVDLNSSMDTL